MSQNFAAYHVVLPGGVIWGEFKAPHC